MARSGGAERSRESAPDSQVIQAGRDRVVRDALPGLTTGIAVLQAVLAVVHALGSASERPLVLVDAASAALAAGLRFALGKGALPERWAHPFAVGCGALAALVVLVHLRVLGDPLQTLMLCLIAIGAGSILLSFQWLAVLAATSLLGWLAVTASLGFPPGSRRLGIALLGSWAAAAMILGARLRSFRRLEELRAQNEDRLTRDVTEARGLAESMRLSEESHRLLFEQSPLPMWVVERETLQFLAVNDAAVSQYGYSRAEFLELTLRDVHPPEEVPKLLADLASDAAEQGTPLTTRHRKKDGTLMDVEVIAHDIAFGEWSALLAVLTDVTERRRAAEERERMIDELKEALANVKTLRGLIPICSSCKKIRDDKGFWSQVEVYVRDRSEAEFSHGICPECMKKLYGR
jgi:PAS domain S-box-containing protein